MPSISARRPSRRALMLLWATAIAVAALAAVFAGGAAAARGPDVIPLPPGWQPEGIAAGRGDDLFVGSIPTGQVLRVDGRTGDTEVIVEQRRGRAAIGIEYFRGKLFVAGGPTGRAFVYDARTGEDIVDVGLSDEPTFINDLTVTRRGAWFTDSQRPRLYRVQLERRRGETTARTRILPITGDLRYDDDPASFEANGIASARAGRVLIVVQSRTGKLFRVNARTGVSREIELRGAAGDVVNGDGLLLVGRTLYVVQNRLNQIAEVRLSRRLGSGRIRAVLRDEDFDVPTTVALSRGDLYAVNARFGTTPTPTTEYDVVRVDRRGGGR